MSDSVLPHRQQPTRLCRPWDSPGNNTGVGCHFLLQCVKVKSLSHVRLFATPWIAAYQAPPSMGFSRQEYWSGLPLPSPRRPYLMFFFFFKVLILEVCCCYKIVYLEGEKNGSLEKYKGKTSQYENSVTQR